MSRTTSFFERENNNLTFWYIISFLLGILCFFYLWDDLRSAGNYNISNYLIVFTVLSMAFVVLARYSFNPITSFFLKLVVAFIIGYLAAQIRSSNNFTELLTEIKDIEIEGQISKIKPTPFGSQITLTNISISDYEALKYETLNTSFYNKDQAQQPGIRDCSKFLPLERLGSCQDDDCVATERKCLIPYYIRINLSNKYNRQLLNGDRIKLTVDLFPLPEELVPYGYNFRKIAFFSNIGATGRAKSTPVILAQEKQIVTLHEIRKHIYSYLIENLGYKRGHFAAALFLGETGGIDKTTLNNMRYAGISHILCVSGLHLSLVASIIFLSSRVILNLSDNLSHRLDIKKISALISIVVSFLYLLLTGMQIAASRAFIMVLFVMSTIIISRQVHPMRSLAVACLILLLKNPEYAILPSFQLSFVAVLSLLAGFQYYTQSSISRKSLGGFFGNLKLYFYSNIYSSLVASAATSPIVMYHFYSYSNYSLLANLIAVPLTSFVIMPCGVLSIILYPVSLDWIPMYFIGLSIDAIKYVASTTTSLPFAIIYTGYVSNIAIFSFLIGFFWICIWQTRIRLLGILGPLTFIILFYYSPKPDILINKKANFIAEKKGDKVIIYSDHLSSFAKNFVANWFGCKKAFFVKRNMGKIIKIYDGQYGEVVEINLQESYLASSGQKLDLANLSVIYRNQDYSKVMTIK